MTPRVIVNDHCLCAEGPLWHPEEKRLYYVDIDNGYVYRYDPATETRERCFEGEMVGGITIQNDGSLLVFMARGAIRHWRDGIVTTLVDEIPAERATRFNDVIADPRGRVLCGLMSPPDRPGRLYRFDTDQTLTLLLEGIGCSNGMAFIDNDRKVYYTDSVAKEIYLFDYDVETGSLANRRVFWKSETSLPDGLTVDTEGCIWTAQWNGGCIVRLWPDGTEDRRIEIPGANNVTSCIFGGDDLTDLYITTASKGDESSPNAGAIFHLRPGVQGLPEYRSRVRVVL
ncbi:MAG TPA: SMP-30/gluconolactonase/LRE family protein [Capsulimonadaceae bacterium]|jgi:D-xylonolactonase